MNGKRTAGRGKRVRTKPERSNCHDGDENAGRGVKGKGE